MKAYYNECDPKAAAWLRELIKAGHIAAGDVDERSITEVQPSDLTPYAQCHFFAGIGGWSLALRLAGVPDDEPVWTGSCPCQPFSAAGKQLGEADERHLWPVFRELIRAGKPSAVFGEQVASKAGRGWLAGVFADLEAMGYRRAGADLCAAGVGAPHIRQRLFWVAYARHTSVRWAAVAGEEESGRAFCETSERGIAGRVADSEHNAGRADEPGRRQERREADGRTCGLEHPEGDGREQRRAQSGGRGATCGCGTCGLGHPLCEGRQGEPLGLLGPGNQGSWSNYDLLPCLDGKARRVESGTFPLAHGVPGRVGLLRGYGNAIVPQVAAEFIQAALEALSNA